MVEIDVVSSTDGTFFLFHDGYEQRHFGITDNIRTLSTAQIDNLNYSWCSETAGIYPVERLSTLLEACPETFFNVDRSWFWWPRLLDYLAEHGRPDHLILKSPATAEFIELLAAHPVKFPYIPFVSSVEEVEDVWNARHDVNVVGFELVTADGAHPFCRPSYLRSLQSRGLLILVNAMNMPNGAPLYAGHDDESSLLGDPDTGWGYMVDRGVDIIQTDWPGPLREYLRTRLQFEHA